MRLYPNCVNRDISAVCFRHWSQQRLIPDAAAKRDGEYWDQVVGFLTRPDNRKLAIQDASVIQLASRYAVVFGKADYVSRTWLRLADSDRMRPTARLVRRQRLDAALS